MSTYRVGDIVGRKDFKRLPPGTVLVWEIGGGVVFKTHTHYVTLGGKFKSSKNFDDGGYRVLAFGKLH